MNPSAYIPIMLQLHYIYPYKHPCETHHSSM